MVKLAFWEVAERDKKKLKKDLFKKDLAFHGLNNHYDHSWNVKLC